MRRPSKRAPHRNGSRKAIDRRHVLVWFGKKKPKIERTFYRRKRADAARKTVEIFLDESFVRDQPPTGFRNVERFERKIKIRGFPKNAFNSVRRAAASTIFQTEKKKQNKTCVLTNRLRDGIVQVKVGLLTWSPPGGY